MNFFTSIYAGIVIFAILGYKAHLSYDKCLLQREQMIDYYLSDYNLKVIDYGSVFDPVIQNRNEGKQDEAIEAVESSAFDSGNKNEVEIEDENKKTNESVEKSEKNNGRKDEKDIMEEDEESEREQEMNRKEEAEKRKTRAKAKLGRKTRSPEVERSKKVTKAKIKEKKSESGSEVETRSSEQTNVNKETKEKANKLKKTLNVVPSLPASSSRRKIKTSITTSTSTVPTTSTTTSTLPPTTTTSEAPTSNNSPTNKSEDKQKQQDKNLSVEDLEGSATDYYDSSDAIASIRSLDKQLDSVSAKGSFDYGDSDTEFIIDASSLISKNDLDKVIEAIPGLQKCSVRNELDEATKGTGLVFIVMAEAISQFENAPIWAIAFFSMLLLLGLDSQFGNLEGLLSSIADLNFANSIKRQWITGR